MERSPKKHQPEEMQDQSAVLPLFHLVGKAPFRAPPETAQFLTGHKEIRLKVV